VLIVLAGFIFLSRSQRLHITITIIAVSVVLEAVQLLVPGRDAGWVDVLWNLFGALLGWITTYMLRFMVAGNDNN
jgi:VanZ family protein